MPDRPVCLITGASRGIGRALAVKFAGAGYDLGLCGRDASGLQTAASAAESAGVETLCVPLDLAEVGAGRRFVSATWERFSRIDVLINNAGLAPNCGVADLSDEQIRSTITVNTAAVVETTTAAWPRLSVRGGVVICISSMAAIDPLPGFSLYAGTKAFVEAFTGAIANEGRAAGIRAYGVRPGAVETPLLRSLFPDFPAEDCVSPDDVAALTLNLCSQPMQFSSGQTVTIKK